MADEMTPEQEQKFQGLAKQLIEAKRAKKEAEARVAEIEDLILKEFRAPSEGQATYKNANFKIVVKGVMNRKIDIKAIEELGLQYPPFKKKNELDKDAMSWLLKNRPEDYEEVIKHITTKPGKTSINITEVI